ncbi:hypothetical protein OG372_00605 [Streptomyces sp. NBC_01020]|nr:hypothetical protein OG372_00605 [Streptomyces sp. NBC_01020]
MRVPLTCSATHRFGCGTKPLPSSAGLPPDHLDGGVVYRAVDDPGVLEALVDQDLLQAHPALFGRLVQQGDAGLVVVRAGRQDHHNGT